MFNKIDAYVTGLTKIDQRAFICNVKFHNTLTDIVAPQINPRGVVNARTPSFITQEGIQLLKFLSYFYIVRLNINSKTQLKIFFTCFLHTVHPEKPQFQLFFAHGAKSRHAPLLKLPSTYV